LPLCCTENSSKVNHEILQIRAKNTNKTHEKEEITFDDRRKFKLAAKQSLEKEIRRTIA